MRCSVPVFALCALTCSSQLSAQPEVSEELLSPLGQGFTYIPSPAPVDLVTVGPAGSRMAIYRNGEPGPKFDQIINTDPTEDGGGGIAVVFSPDGSRYAYVGRKRGEFTLIADGEEIATGNYDGQYNKIAGVGFTPDNTLFYRVQQQDESGQNAPWRFVIGGESSPLFNARGFRVMLSPVGHGYIMFGALAENNEQVFIRDGEVAETAATKFVYRHDGKLFTLERDPDSGDSIVRLDGEELYRGQFNPQEIVPAPAGESWALKGHSPAQGTGMHLVVNGEEIQGAISSVGAMHPLWFTDDGEHWATIIQPDYGRQYVVIDGEEWDEYQAIADFSFSPDGSRHAYWGRSPTGAYLVIDGEEQNGVSSATGAVTWSDNSEHLGWFEYQSNPVKRSVVYDGEPYVGDHQLQQITVSLSPDGSRMGFIQGNTVHEMTSDGVKAYEDIRVVPSGHDPHGRLRPIPNGYIYSPDSKHIVYHGTDMQQRQQGIYFNDKRAFEITGSAVMRIGFSPDNEHFYLVLGVGNQRELYIDGERAMAFGAHPFENEESMWHIDDEGVLSFMIADNEGIKRITVKPDPAHTVATMLNQ